MTPRTRSSAIQNFAEKWFDMFGEHWLVRPADQWRMLDRLREQHRDIDQFLTNASDDEITEAMAAAFEMSDGVRRTGEWLDRQMMEGKSNG